MKVLVTGHKECRICGKVKPITMFHKSGTRSTKNNDGRRSECSECRKVGGLSPSDASGLLMKKEGLVRPPLGNPCQCCGRTDKMLFCDHDHKTGKFRGWLCQTCNTALSRLGDDLTGVMKMVNYLKLS